MRVKFWGVRGSTPTPQAENMRYGGNTSCVEVRHGQSLYIFDCGTGFRILGDSLLQPASGKSIFAHVFVSHFHWDHIQGMPFFKPMYGYSDNRFIFHSSSRTRSLKQVMEEQMASPYFPVAMTEMKAQREFYEIDAGRAEIDGEIKLKQCGSTIPRVAWDSGLKLGPGHWCMPPTTNPATLRSTRVCVRWPQGRTS